MVMTKSEALKILEIAEGSTQDEIRASYKKLALRWHPDKHSNSAESTKKFQEISEAYKRLTSKEDDDDIRISMADMFDLFAHIFFSNNGYFAPDNFFYSDDEYNDEYDGYNDDDYDDDDDDFLMSDSDDDFPIYRSRQHHAKYSDMMARRVSKATANSFKQEVLKKKKQVRPEISEEEARKNAEELIQEEEKSKKKAEKRKARKKRNRANRKKREREKSNDSKKTNEVTTPIEKVENVQENHDRSKENINPEGDEQIAKGNEDDCPMSSKNRDHECSDDDNTHDETWDTSSAFFNHAARRATSTLHETTSTAGTSSKTIVNRTVNNEASNGEVEQTDKKSEREKFIQRSRYLAALGNSEANEGNYVEAINYFTQAISLHDEDFRFFGNRSFCYDRLGDYSKALEDAEVSIKILPNWAKGYFRKGRALSGLKQHAEAEKAFLQVLKLDRHCEDAKLELYRVRVQQLKDMGFGHGQCVRAIRLYGTVSDALDAILSGKVKDLHIAMNEEDIYVSDGEIDEDQGPPKPAYADPIASLWVGNIDGQLVTERQLAQLFSRFGKITLIRILPQSFCAFVNYENRENAAKALQSLQGYKLAGQYIRIRFQGQGTEKPSKNGFVDKQPNQSGSTNGNECYFYRTTGCTYGDACRFTHVPKNKGIDMDKVEQKYGKLKWGKKTR